MFQKLKALALLPLVALGLVTYSGTLVTLEAADLSSIGGAVGGFAQTLLSNFIAILPYMVVMVVIFLLIRKLPQWLKLGGGRKRR